MSAGKIVVEAVFNRVTKFMVRFDQPRTEQRRVPEIYVSQEELQKQFGRFPRRVRITIEEVE